MYVEYYLCITYHDISLATFSTLCVKDYGKYYITWTDKYSYVQKVLSVSFADKIAAYAVYSG